VPIEALEESGGHAEFGLGLVGGRLGVGLGRGTLISRGRCRRARTRAIDGLLRQDDPLVVQEGGQRVDRTARGVEGQASTLCLAIDGHPLAPSGPGLWRPKGSRGEVGGQGFGERVGVELAKQALKRRLVGSNPMDKSQGLQQVLALGGTPLGDGQDRQMVGKDGGRCQCQDRRQRKAGALTSPGVGDRGEGRQQVAGGDGDRARRTL
jgi:hypothetical protein